MRCEAVQRLEDALRTGELSKREIRAVLGHIGACKGCSSELSFLKALAGQARQLASRAPDGFLEEVISKMGDRFGSVRTRLGKFWVGFNDHGITLLRPAEISASRFGELYQRLRGRQASLARVPARMARIVRRAASGSPHEPVAVDLSGLAPFQTRVLSLLRAIPRGEVRTYTWLAREAGRPQAARAVGNAMARNPVPFILPCHRVVPKGGGIGQYAFGSELKRDLLRREGAFH